MVIDKGRIGTVDRLFPSMSIHTVTIPSAFAGSRLARHVLANSAALGSIASAGTLPHRRADRAWGRSPSRECRGCRRTDRQAEPVQHPAARRIAIGEDEPPPRNLAIASITNWIGGMRARSMSWTIVQELVRIDAMPRHQAGKRRAMLVKIVLLDAPRLGRIVRADPG